MKKFIVRYYDLSGELCSVWVEANTKEKAKEEVYSEYWDIQKIVEVYESK